jgi:hypothetical protein
MRSLSISKMPSLAAGCLWIVFVGLSLMLLGCSQNYISTETFPKGESVALRRIAVFPIQRLDPDEAVDHTLRCQICGTVFTLGSVEPQAEKVVEDVFLQTIGKTGKFEVVPPERVQGVFQRISANSLKVPLKDLLIKSGRELGADAILYGHVYRFRERKGYAYGTDSTASVAFALDLVSVSDGSLLWKGKFDKTQLSLMENIFQIFTFYKERGRWLTARELTEEGVTEMLKTFPGGQ